MSERKKIAAIVTTYRPHSHADVIVTKFLKGFPSDEGVLDPRVEIASFYVDQFPYNDLSRRFAAEHNVPIYNSIAEAMRLGGKELAVDGVLLIGEHGEYAWNEKEQHLYPRKYFLEQICGVMATSKRGVPVFNDKHLSYNWHDAKWMYDRMKSLRRALYGRVIAGNLLARPVARTSQRDTPARGSCCFLFWSRCLWLSRAGDLAVYG